MASGGALAIERRIGGDPVNRAMLAPPFIADTATLDTVVGASGGRRRGPCRRRLNPF